MIALMAVLVGVLNFAASDPGLDYAVTPRLPQLSALGVRLAHDLRADGTPARHITGLAHKKDQSQTGGGID